MEIAVLLNSHENGPLVLDTIKAVKKWVTDKILVVVDGAYWKDWGERIDLPVDKIAGFVHNQPRGPYRNVAFGLLSLYQKWPNVDWYCYIEPDVLFCNKEYLKDLIKAENKKAWCVGTNLRKGKFKFPIIERMFNIKLKTSQYLLGCCVFYHKNFFKVLNDIQFFEKFLMLTNEFQTPYFPGYKEQGGYDLSEHLYPTLAYHFGGKMYELSSWSDGLNDWLCGDFKKYPIRWKPEIYDMFLYEHASIVHPVKHLNHPFRMIQRFK